MAWVSTETDFDPDALGLPVVGIAADFGRQGAGEHHHSMGQLLFTQIGCVSISLHGQRCMLPPGRVVWIPPYTAHRAEMKGVVGYRSIYLNADAFPTLPRNVAVFETTELLRAAMERVARAAFDTDWKSGKSAAILTVCLNEIDSAQQAPTVLQWPVDSRLRCALTDDLPPALNVLAKGVGASEKTIGRIFLRETGLSYRQWRQQWRLLKSIELLTKYPMLTPVTQALGFSSDSAFIAFFRKMTGHAPKQYMSLSNRPASGSESVN